MLLCDKTNNFFVLFCDKWHIALRFVLNGTAKAI